MCLECLLLQFAVEYNCLLTSLLQTLLPLNICTEDYCRNTDKDATLVFTEYPKHEHPLRLCTHFLQCSALQPLQAGS